MFLITRNMLQLTSLKVIKIKSLIQQDSISTYMKTSVETDMFSLVEIACKLD